MHTAACKICIHSDFVIIIYILQFDLNITVSLFYESRLSRGKRLRNGHIRNVNRLYIPKYHMASCRKEAIKSKANCIT